MNGSGTLRLPRVMRNRSIATVTVTRTIPSSRELVILLSITVVGNGVVGLALLMEVKDVVAVEHRS